MPSFSITLMPYAYDGMQLHAKAVEVVNHARQLAVRNHRNRFQLEPYHIILAALQIGCAPASLLRAAGLSLTKEVEAIGKSLTPYHPNTPFHETVERMLQTACTYARKYDHDQITVTDLVIGALAARGPGIEAIDRSPEIPVVIKDCLLDIFVVIRAV